MNAWLCQFETMSKETWTNLERPRAKRSTKKVSKQKRPNGQKALPQKETYQEIEDKLPTPRSHQRGEDKLVWVATWHQYFAMILSLCIHPSQNMDRRTTDWEPYLPLRFSVCSLFQLPLELGPVHLGLLGSSICFYSTHCPLGLWAGFGGLQADRQTDSPDRPHKQRDWWMNKQIDKQIDRSMGDR